MRICTGKFLWQIWLFFDNYTIKYYTFDVLKAKKYICKMGSLISEKQSLIHYIPDNFTMLLFCVFQTRDSINFKTKKKKKVMGGMQHKEKKIKRRKHTNRFTARLITMIITMEKKVQINSQQRFFCKTCIIIQWF